MLCLRIFLFIYLQLAIYSGHGRGGFGAWAHWVQGGGSTSWMKVHLGASCTYIHAFCILVNGTKFI